MSQRKHLNIQQAAEYMGGVSVSTVRRWLANPAMRRIMNPAKFSQKLMLFETSNLDALVDAQREFSSAQTAVLPPRLQPRSSIEEFTTKTLAQRRKERHGTTKAAVSAAGTEAARRNVRIPSGREAVGNVRRINRA